MDPQRSLGNSLQVNEMHSVLVTGAAGNLGGKLVTALAGRPWCRSVFAVDRASELFPQCYAGMAKVKPLCVDLTNLSNLALDGAMKEVDAVVHFAVLNALPDSTWAEAAYSFDMLAGLLVRARDLGTRRFVFASSNHVLGQYKEPPKFDALTPGCLSTDLFAPGTKWETPEGIIDGYAYGASKVFGERLCLAAAQPDGLSTVSIRVGWCQVGENHPRTMNAGGNPKLAKAGIPSKTGADALRWFRNMWLSTRDFEQLFERAILADPDKWPGPSVVVNGVSANTGMAWEIESAKRLLDYRPIDDVWAALKES